MRALLLKNGKRGKGGKKEKGGKERKKICRTNVKLLPTPLPFTFLIHKPTSPSPYRYTMCYNCKSNEDSPATPIKGGLQN